MSLRSVTVWAWIAFCFLFPVSAHVPEDRNPYPGETIAQFLGLDITNLTTYSQVLPNDTANDDDSKDPNKPADAKNKTELDGRDIKGTGAEVPWKPSPATSKSGLFMPAQRTLSAAYNSSADSGYNITIPGCTPADSVIGDWQAPSGDLIENCTLAQMAQKLRLPPSTLSSFTLGRTESLLAKLNDTLQKGICEDLEPPLEPPDRELKAEPPSRFRFNPELQSGYFSSLLLVLLGSFGVSFTGLHLGIIHEGITGNITLTTEVLILSSFATFGTMCVIMIERERRRLAHAEAVVLNLFIAMVEKIYEDAGEHFRCVQEIPLKQGVQTLVNKMSQGARVLVTEDVQASAMKEAGASSVNLVGQWDVENQLPEGIPSGMIKQGSC